MEAIITELCNDKVCINTGIGNIKGIWCSDSPAKLKKYDLELDSNEIINSNMINYSSLLKPLVEMDNDRVIFNGLVEEIQDKVLFLRLSKDIVMLEISDESYFLKFVNQFVRIVLSNIELYDTGLI